MKDNLVANASTTINAPLAKVWDALVNPEMIRQYMFGTTVVSDWKEGSPIIWKGEWEGKAYEDKGMILKIEPQKMLSYSHFSPTGGSEDKPENYHTATVKLENKDGQTFISISQDNSATEEARKHSQKNWETMLGGMKKVLEK